MVIEIETTIESINELHLINKILELKLQPSPMSLDEIMIYLKYVILSDTWLIFGKGASHVWISRATDGERILLITE